MRLTDQLTGFLRGSSAVFLVGDVHIGTQKAQEHTDMHSGLCINRGEFHKSSHTHIPQTLIQRALAAEAQIGWLSVCMLEQSVS